MKLTFNREQILYDVKNIAYIEGHKLDEKQQHIQHTIVDICEDGNIDRVNRVLYSVYLSVIELLYPYTKNEIMDNELNNDMREPEEYVINMIVPETMSQTSINMLNTLIHDYFVVYVIYDWIGILIPDASQYWMLKLSGIEKDIISVKNRRQGTITRPNHPF
ncbi:MAG: hypothetical protein ACI4E1_10200 [Lachnospira sp.]